MRNSTFQKQEKRETKIESINKVQFRSQQHLDAWNIIVKNLSLDKPVDCIYLWRVYYTDNLQMKHYGIQLKTFDQETKKYEVIKATKDSIDDVLVSLVEEEFSLKHKAETDRIFAQQFDKIVQSNKENVQFC